MRAAGSARETQRPTHGDGKGLRNMELGLEKCVPFISSEFTSSSGPSPSSRPCARPLSITISRQSGSGAHVIAKELAGYLQLAAPDPSTPWIIFDRNLVEQVLSDHHLPARFARFMPEDRTSEVADVFDELLGAHPPSSVLVHQVSETILKLAQRGHVILIGRGANIITRQFNSVFHVRLVGSLEKRVAHVREVFGLTKKAAIELIVREDRGRTRYVHRYFGRNVDDPVLYHLVLNTDLISYESAARLIAQQALKLIQPQSPLQQELHSNDRIALLAQRSQRVGT